MPLIERVDDEVTLALSLFALIVIVFVAWWSTSVSERPINLLIIRGTTVAISPNQQRTNNVQQQANNVSSESEQTVQTRESAGTKSGPDGEDSENGGKAQSATSEDTGAGGTCPSDKGGDPGSHNENDELVAGSTTEAGPTSGGNSPCAEQTPASDASSSELRRRTVPQNAATDRDVPNLSQEVTTNSGRPEEPSSTAPGSNATVDASVLSNSEQICDNDYGNLLPGHVRIRIKFLNETERLVQSKPEETIASFRSKHFGDDVARGKQVRFIYNGQLLNQDEKSLRFYGLNDMSTVHCLMTNRESTHRGARVDEHHLELQDLDISRLMVPLFGIILLAIWYCRLEYHYYFSAVSSLSLVAMTCLYGLGIVLLWRTDHDAPELETGPLLPIVEE